MSKKLYVGNLPYTVTDEELVDLFSVYGPVESGQVIKDKLKGDRSKGFGFVELKNDEDGMKALEMDGKEVQGRTLVVSEAKPMKPREERSGGFRNNRNDYQSYNNKY